MKRLTLSATFVLAGLLSHAHAEPQVPDAAWATGWLDAGYLPRHAALATAADALASASDTLCAHPDKASLEKTRTAWLQTSLAWRSLDGASGGPMVLERLGRKIDFRPTRPADIEASLDASAAERRDNAATRGLAAAEYLLWGDAEPAAQLKRLRDPARCQALQAISNQIASDVHALDAGWQSYRAQLGGESDFFRQNLLSEHINLMITALEGLQKRLPKDEAPKAANYIEWRSGSSKTQLLAQIDGFGNAFFAKPGPATRLDSALAGKMQERFAVARQQCSTLPDRLETSGAGSHSARKACGKAIAALKTTLQDEVAVELDLTLGFTEGDGD
ncbi:imelysin family protein [Chitinilyticum aquatile]|uniref:imelysin family protein n=1 Tax=Chitinilyticum aquatile TaxID=362520 RepID=UPI00041493DA|nr:imelysin family protein [Chitinilyticum aquatile]